MIIVRYADDFIVGFQHEADARRFWDATGLHGKDIIIDARIHYTGSLNWASHRGRAEIMHRTENADYARTVLDYLQARHIRSAAGPGAQPRTCPQCQGATQVVNQARHMLQ